MIREIIDTINKLDIKSVWGYPSALFEIANYALYTCCSHLFSSSEKKKKLCYHNLFLNTIDNQKFLFQNDDTCEQQVYKSSLYY